MLDTALLQSPRLGARFGVRSARGSNEASRKSARCAVLTLVLRSLPVTGKPAASKENHPLPRPGSLGEVLYAKSTRVPDLEQDWADLVRSIAAGEQWALHALYERAHRLVFTLALRIASNRQTAEELTVDVFHDVWRNASTYDPATGTVLGWILNQARSRAIDRLRFESRQKRLLPQTDEWRQWTAPRESDDAIALRQQSQRVRNALASLTPEEQQAIETAYFSELTHNEVALRLNQPLGTIKTRIRSGLAKLRAALGNEEQP
jgi:RNA polymerase sigma-70 factor, ECF subfamily